MIVVHHLDYSRSTRVLWLLEELGRRYELVRYARRPGGPAPVALQLVHPLGKSPSIVDGELVLAESSAILRYLNSRYGDGRFAPQDRDEAAQHDEWLDFVEGSAALPLLMLLMGRGPAGLPEPLRRFAQNELLKMFDHVAQQLTDRPFLMGDELTLADIQLSYILAIAQSAGLLQTHAALGNYLARLQSRPALQRAIERGGPMAPS